VSLPHQDGEATSRQFDGGLPVDQTDS